MPIRETILKKPAIATAIAVVLFLTAGVIFAVSMWPTKRGKLDQAFFTVDDGKTWFADSMYKVPPVAHDGGEAVMAQVFSYADGSKQFCAYLTKFTPEGKQKLEAQINAAVAANRSAGSASLYSDRNFRNANVLVKKPGGGEWLPYSDPRALKVMTPTAPDGSVVDQVLVY